jgi:hypothetical protein
MWDRSLQIGCLNFIYAEKMNLLDVGQEPADWLSQLHIQYEVDRRSKEIAE